MSLHFLSGIIHLVRVENFPKDLHFLLPDTHTYTSVSGGVRILVFREVLYTY